MKSSRRCPLITGPVRMLLTLGLVSLVAALAPPVASGAKAVDLAKGIPYQQMIILNAGDPRCNAFGCDVFFPAVPDGMRLVVQHVSLDQIVLPGFNSSAILRVNNFDATGIRINLIPHESALSGGNVVVRYSQPVFGFIDEGLTPLIQTGAGGAGMVMSFGTAYFISGLLIPLK